MYHDNKEPLIAFHFAAGSASHPLSSPVLTGTIDAEAREAIASVCSRPEIYPFSQAVVFSVEKDLEEPFKVVSANHVILNPDALKFHSLAALFVRYALEITLWHRTLGDHASLAFFIAVGLLSSQSACIYLRSMIEQEQQTCRSGIGDRFLSFLDPLGSDGSLEDVEEYPHDAFVSRIIPLLRLQDIENIHPATVTDEVLAEAYPIIRKAQGIAAPLEYLLTLGGDTRLRTDKKSGLNAYGCSSKPRPWAVTFASTTASSVSEYAFRYAESLRQRLIFAVCHDRFDKQYASEIDSLRTEIIRIFDLDESGPLEIIMSSSGTDAELLISYFAACGDGRSVTNILVGAEETGSGVALAAKGCHFSEQTPFGKAVKKGDPIDGMPIDRLRVVDIPIRDSDGAHLSAQEVDGRVKLAVEKAIAGGCRVLLHLVDCSKTGIRAPGMGTIAFLKDKYGRSIDIVVDACQLRTGKNKIKAYLKNDFMVVITGSKFYAGPPFSGALIVPPEIVKRVESDAAAPAGLRDYFGTSDFSCNMSGFSRFLSDRKNTGLLLRWQAALWEMKAFADVSEKYKYLILVLFGESIRKAIEANPNLKIVEVPSIYRWMLPQDCEWDWLPTIFTFEMYHTDFQGRQNALTLPQAKTIYRLLNMDISRLMPDEAGEEEKRLAAQRFHIGQPVKTSRRDNDWTGALRISAGARLVSGILFDNQLGRHFAERLNREIGDACSALDKISLIIKYMPYLTSQKASNRFDGANDKPIYMI